MYFTPTEHEALENEPPFRIFKLARCSNVNVLIPFESIQLTFALAVGSGIVTKNLLSLQTEDDILAVFYNKNENEKKTDGPDLVISPIKEVGV